MDLVLFDFIIVAMTEEEIKELGRQLSNPNGEKGLQVAEMMNESNNGMTNAAIDSLHLQKSDKVMEMGHGNCAHLETVLSKAEGIQYTGLEISEDMSLDAKKRNAIHVKQGTADFINYDGLKIPFGSESFDKVFTVNTIYFWNDAALTASELKRILKPGGKLSVAFAQKSFMETLPFTRYGFNLVATEDVVKLLEANGFVIRETIDRRESVRAKSGEFVERDFTVVVASPAN